MTALEHIRYYTRERGDRDPLAVHGPISCGHEDREGVSESQLGMEPVFSPSYERTP